MRNCLGSNGSSALAAVLKAPAWIPPAAARTIRIWRREHRALAMRKAATSRPRAQQPARCISSTSAGRLATNLSHTERAPSFNELFANGAHPATGQYEVGNPNLKRGEVQRHRPAAALEARAQLSPARRFPYALQGLHRALQHRHAARGRWSDRSGRRVARSADQRGGGKVQPGWRRRASSTSMKAWVIWTCASKPTMCAPAMADTGEPLPRIAPYPSRHRPGLSPGCF